MTALRTATVVELAKAASSRVLRWTSGLLVVGVCVLSAAMLAAVRAGREDLTRKLGPVAALRDWDALLAVATQVTAAAGVLALGVGLAWLVGREFADGTVGGLFGLPVPREDIAAAKLLLFTAWATVLGLLLPAALLLTGVIAGLGVPDANAVAGLARLALLVVLSAGVASPVAVAATLGRGLLPGVAVAVGLLVVAQVGAVLGAGPWFPLTAPALWATAAGSVPWPALAGPPALLVVACAATALAWRRLELDR